MGAVPNEQYRGLILKKERDILKKISLLSQFYYFRSEDKELLRLCRNLTFFSAKSQQIEANNKEVYRRYSEEHRFRLQL